MMDKEAFLKLLKSKGFVCDMNGTLPTVHVTAGDKSALKVVKNLVKENAYDSSFSIKYDGRQEKEPENDFLEAVSAEVEAAEVSELETAPAAEEVNVAPAAEESAAELTEETATSSDFWQSDLWKFDF